MKTFFFIFAYLISINIYAEADCPSSHIDDCPKLYHEKCHHLECVKHKCKCFISGDDDYLDKTNYHPAAF